jgi:DNA ligase-associated metallophosphoesterase
MTDSSLITQRHGMKWRLMADKALYFEEGQALFIADPHFGKAASLRAVGLPIPEGDTQGDCDRLSTLLGATAAKRLIILGDFFHHAAGKTQVVHECLRQWRRMNDGIRMDLVRGNHDLCSGDPWPDLHIQMHQPIWDWHGLACSHLGSEASILPMLCGHLHPAIRLPRAGKGHLRLPCFWFQSRRLVLPSFGRFTGSQRIEPISRDRLFATDGKRVMEVSC